MFCFVLCFIFGGNAPECISRNILGIIRIGNITQHERCGSSLSRIIASIQPHSPTSDFAGAPELILYNHLFSNNDDDDRVEAHELTVF